MRTQFVLLSYHSQRTRYEFLKYNYDNSNTTYSPVKQNKWTYFCSYVMSVCFRIHFKNFESVLATTSFNDLLEFFHLPFRSIVLSFCYPHLNINANKML